ncbi:MAG: hypothetical protein H6729_00130 [Deltaproteobacteria bacterium]|nr:hypothetical protein [Deltaproteobacteria bacterium]
MRAASILRCYDGELNTLADLAGDFDAASPQDTRRWIIAQWRSVASALGWLAELEVALNSLAQFSESSTVAPAPFLDAFERWHERRAYQPRNLSTTQARSLDRVRHDVLKKLDGIGRGTLNRWRPWISSTDLPSSACVELSATTTPRVPSGPGGIKSAAPKQTYPNQPLPMMAAPKLDLVSPRGRSYRAFRADVAPGYFGDKVDAPNMTECSFPVILSLGTFPYIYGNALAGVAPGLMWGTGRPWAPARLGLEIMSSFWTAELNLSQDARVVVAQYQRFRTTTDRVLSAVPAAPSEGHRAIIGEVYRNGGLLHVYQGPVELARFVGPWGAISASSYNYVKRRFAAFFAARRAYLRAYSSLDAASRSAIARNPDPCVRAEEVVSESA